MCDLFTAEAAESAERTALYEAGIERPEQAWVDSEAMARAWQEAR